MFLGQGIVYFGWIKRKKNHFVDVYTCLNCFNLSTKYYVNTFEVYTSLYRWIAKETGDVYLNVNVLI